MSENEACWSVAPGRHAVASFPMTLFPRPLLPALMLACSSTALARMSPDPTGLWFDPAESGWGLSVTQQGDKVFAALFVYDDAHKPTWYVASDMEPAALVGGSLSNDADGTLYRASGPWFGGPFDPALVTVSPAGQIHIAYSSTDAQSLELAYTIDGRSVTKTVHPQTWSTNRPLIAGMYAGGLYLPNHSGTCSPVNFTGNASAVIMQAGTNAQLEGVRFMWGTGSDTGCLLEAGYSQHGQLGALTGLLFCGPIGGPTLTATLQVTNLLVSEHGFSGPATMTRDSCTYTGHFGGVATN